MKKIKENLGITIITLFLVFELFYTITNRLEKVSNKISTILPISAILFTLIIPFLYLLVLFKNRLWIWNYYTTVGLMLTGDIALLFYMSFKDSVNNGFMVYLLPKITFVLLVVLAITVKNNNRSTLEERNIKIQSDQQEMKEKHPIMMKSLAVILAIFFVTYFDLFSLVNSKYIKHETNKHTKQSEIRIVVNYKYIG